MTANDTFKEGVMEATYRVKYWRWVNPEFGEWITTGLMSKNNAEIFADSIRGYHENVTVYEDEQEAQ